MQGRLIVAGCLPGIAPDKLEQVFPGKSMEIINLEKIDELFSDFEVKFKDIPDANLQHGFVKAAGIAFLRTFTLNFRFNRVFLKKCSNRLAESFGEALPVKSAKTAFLRISRGCAERCSYCNIFRAIGQLRSKEAEECQREYSKLLERGYRRFRLLADNLGAYGLDCGKTFADLLHKLSEVDKGYRVNWYLSELHPRWVIAYKDALSQYVSEGKITDIFCPVQSGSNRILRLMNRHHGIEEITGILKRFRELQPGLRLQTNFIIGFPSETEEDVAASISAAESVRFDQVILHAYYDAYNSVSSGMEGKISQEKIIERISRADDLLQKAGVVCFCDKDIWSGRRQIHFLKKAAGSSAGRIN